MRIRRSAACALVAASMLGAGAAPSGAFGIPLTPTQAQVWVAGRQIAFSHLGIAYGDPVVPVDDAGLALMLHAVGAKSSWQPGTRFVAIARADGALITFSLGSNAVAVDGTPAPIPFAPFTSGSQFYIPLLPLARALDLGVRGFRGGYVFVPQVTAVIGNAEARRAVVHISGSAPMVWRSTFQARQAQRTLELAFPGFGTDATGKAPIKGPYASSVTVSESGPPGYPTTFVDVAVARDAKFVARRTGAGVDIVVAATDTALRQSPAIATPPAIRVAAATPAPQPATPAPVPSPTESVDLTSASPSPEPSGIATAEPLGPEPEASSSPLPLPSASPQDQKITDVSVADFPTGTRITLTLTGPVTFEWHRLADPDDRYWLDIDHAQLVGAAQTLSSSLPFIKEIKISQHLLVPDKVVRVSITPTQAVEVNVGAIEGAPDQLGIEIENQPPAPDAAMSGVGAIGIAVAAAVTQSPSPAPSVGLSPVDPDLIVIDPGHGGSDPGSLNTEYGLTEKTLTLAISQRLEADLKHQGWKVTMTRVGDYDVGDPSGPDAAELQARCDVANAAGARLFVSVHINASVSSAPNGTTTYYWHPGDRAFAEDVQNDVVAQTGIADDGVIRNNFYVIHHTDMSSILVEAAFLSNAHDATLLQQPSFLDKIAAGIARGIGDFTGGPPAPAGQTGRSQQP
jgi:N-acetylmuramoyl-L-alanine amidase